LEQDVRGRAEARWPVVALVCAGVVAVWSVPFAREVPLDYDTWLLPWYQHIVHDGQVRAFSHPFANYAPPYLYLLSAVSLLGLPAFFAIKSLSAAGALWMAFAIYRLLSALCAPRPIEAAAWSLLLPSVVFNVPFLMQADAFWTAPCVLAVAACVRRDFWWLGVWTGIAFAFKAQAVFLAPFVAAMFVRERVPLHYWLTPVWVYALACTPAWLAGWPVGDLLTVYVRQAQWYQPQMLLNVSSAANPWLCLNLIDHALAERSYFVGYLAAAAASLAFVVFAKKWSPLAAAALSSTMIPWLLPGMHERFFFLAEILIFCLAWQRRDAPSIVAALFAQIALIVLLAGMVRLSIPLFFLSVLLETVVLAIVLAINGCNPSCPENSRSFNFRYLFLFK
jgi:Gpi18-like mannosyltransferase